MQLEVYKKTNRYFEDEFKKPVETKEVKLQIGNVLLDITEQQCGEYCLPHVHVTYNGTTYSIDFETFIKNSIKF